MSGLLTTLWLGALVIVGDAGARPLRAAAPVRPGGADQEPRAVPLGQPAGRDRASLATAAAGLSPIVGALVAGILIAETEYHGEVEVMTAPFRGLGLGVFLITVGMSLDLGFIAAQLAAAAARAGRRDAAEDGGDGDAAAAERQRAGRSRPRPAC